jgi:NAD+ diphosphatase
MVTSLKTFSFCPMCGSQYRSTETNPFRLACFNCGYILHENLRASVGALIVKNRQLLLVKRAVAPRRGAWDVPGGFTEPTEHPEASVRREIQEELGVSCRIIRLFGVYAPNPYPYLGKLNYACDLFYLVSLAAGLLKPSDDVASFRWFPLDQLPPDKVVAFPTTRQALHALTQSNFR